MHALVKEAMQYFMQIRSKIFTIEQVLHVIQNVEHC